MAFREIKPQVKEPVNEIKKNSTFDPDKRVEKVTLDKIVDSIANTFDPDKRVENPVLRDKADIMKAEKLKEYFSSAEQRLMHNPLAERFEGERGESLCLPESAECREALEKRGLKGIEYKNGFADFSEASVDAVKIENMTPFIYANFREAYKGFAEKWNGEKKDGKTNWNSTSVQEYIHENKLTIHECEDMKTCQLVPTVIHEDFGHTGGRMEARLRDNMEVNFDA